MSLFDLCFLFFMSVVVIKVLADFNTLMSESGKPFTKEIMDLFRK